MATLVPRPQSFLEQLSRTLGTGAEALSQYQQNKLMKQQQEQQQSSLLQALEGMGYSPQISESLSTLSPNYLRTLLGKQGAGGPAAQLSSFEPDVASEYKEAVQILPKINRLLELNELAKPGGYFSKPSEAGEEYQSLTEQLLPEKGTEAVLRSYRERLPGLNKSPEVRKKLLEDLKNRLERQYNVGEEAQKILRENPNITPSEFNRKVRESVAEEKKAPYLSTEEFIDTHPQETEENKGQGFYEALADNVKWLNESSVGKAAKQAFNLPIFPWSSGVDKDLLQATAQIGKGTAEGIAGLANLPFNIASLLSGGKISSPQILRNLEEIPQQLFDKAGFKNPETPAERAVDQFLGDIGTMLTLGGLGKASQALGKGSKWLETFGRILNIDPTQALKISGIGNIAKWMGETVIGSESAGNAVKLGATLAYPLLGPFRAKSLLSKVEKDMVNALPNTRVKTPDSLHHNINKFFNSLSKKYFVPEATELMNNVESLIPINLNPKDVWNYRNRIIEALKNPEFKAELGKDFSRLNLSISNFLESVAQQSPKFKNSYTEFKDLTNALEATPKIFEFLKKYVRLRPQNLAIYGLYRMLGVSPVKTLAPFAAALGGAGVGEKFIKTMIASPQFRKAYLDVTKGALTQSVNQFNRGVREMNAANKKYAALNKGNKS